MSAVQESNFEPLPNGQPSEHEHEHELELQHDEDGGGRNEKEEEREGEDEEGREVSASAATCSRISQPKKASLNALPFPLARVKRLIRNEDDMRVSSEATYVIAKAAGLFLEKFVEHSFEHMIDDRRHSLTYKDLATHVNHAKRFHFLADFVPEKVTAISALSNRIKQED